MTTTMSVALLAQGLGEDVAWPYLMGLALLALFFLVTIIVVFKYGELWFQAYMSNAE